MQRPHGPRHLKLKHPLFRKQNLILCKYQMVSQSHSRLLQSKGRDPLPRLLPNLASQVSLQRKHQAMHGNGSSRTSQARHNILHPILLVHHTLNSIPHNTLSLLNILNPFKVRRSLMASLMPVQHLLSLHNLSTTRLFHHHPTLLFLHLSYFHHLMHLMLSTNLLEDRLQGPFLISHLARNTGPPHPHNHYNLQQVICPSISPTAETNVI